MDAIMDTNFSVDSLKGIDHQLNKQLIILDLEMQIFMRIAKCDMLNHTCIPARNMELSYNFEFFPSYNFSSFII